MAGELRRSGFDVLGLANNHAGDFGPVALRETVRRLRSAGLATFGAGAVVVMPHWGAQYTAEPEPVQRRVARALVAAGALGQRPGAPRHGAVDADPVQRDHRTQRPAPGGRHRERLARDGVPEADQQRTGCREGDRSARHAATLRALAGASGRRRDG